MKTTLTTGRPPEVATPSATSPPPPARLAALDAFRGAILLLMASSGMGLPQLAGEFPGNAVLGFLGRQCEHAEWAGCTAWDLIQPAFMFMVGVALPWSVANRRARGEGFGSMFSHALRRSLVLVLLAVFLTSAWSRQTEWSFNNVLAQIGLGYPFLFLLAFAGETTAWIGIALVLGVSWGAFALHPIPPPGFDWASVGVPEGWHHLPGFGAHWEKNANLAATFDRWFLNLFPREAPFAWSGGGYTTLNFVPSIATMAFGLCAGRLLRSEELELGIKLRRMVLAGVAGMVLGQILDLSGVCPSVKRLWTPSWALFSGGLVTLLLAGFVAVIDLVGWKRWAFPLVVAGMNPITLYCLWQLSGGFVRETLKTHLGRHVFEAAGAPFVPMLERVSVLLAFWGILLWMYRRRIFIRL